MTATLETVAFPGSAEDGAQYPRDIELALEQGFITFSDADIAHSGVRPARAYAPAPRRVAVRATTPDNASKSSESFVQQDLFALLESPSSLPVMDQTASPASPEVRAATRAMMTTCVNNARRAREQNPPSRPPARFDADTRTQNRDELRRLHQGALR